MRERQDPGEGNTGAVTGRPKDSTTDDFTTYAEPRQALKRVRRKCKAGRLDQSRNYFQVGVLAFQRAELNAADKLVLCVLSSFADNKTGTCWPGIRAIATCASLSTPTVERAIKTLEALDIVEIHREQGRSHVYRLLDHRAQSVS